MGKQAACDIALCDGQSCPHELSDVANTRK